jgi:hypothetical protein
MSVSPAWPQVLDSFDTPLVSEPSAGQLCSDAGLLPIRQFDQRIGPTRAFAEALDDPRDPDLTEHTFLSAPGSTASWPVTGMRPQPRATNGVIFSAILVAQPLPFRIYLMRIVWTCWLSQCGRRGDTELTGELTMLGSTNGSRPGPPRSAWGSDG